MRPTLEQIAERASVSIATVSRVLNNHPGVAPSTRDRVLEAFQQLSPPRQQLLLIGLILPDTHNPFFTELAFELDSDCEKRGAYLLMARSDGRADRELLLLERFSEIAVDGVIFISSGTAPSDTLMRTLTDEKLPPVVALDRGLGISNLDQVTVDGGKGTEQAIDHLVEFGHEKIAYIKGLAGTANALERFESFLLAMAKNRLEIRPEWIFEGDFEVPKGREFGERLLTMKASDRPTAVLVANDLMAIGLMQRLQEAEWPLPHDLSIIGFDDIPACTWTHPRLTTVAQPTRRLVREGLSLLLQRVSERQSHRRPTGPAKAARLTPVLVPRASVAPPKGTVQLRVVREAAVTDDPVGDP